MADKEQRPSTARFEIVRPGVESASLVISSDVLVMMLRIVGVLRTLLLTPSISTSPASEEIRGTVQDLERRIAATLTALDEMLEEPAQEANDR
jgi:hypothetical protein